MIFFDAKNIRECHVRIEKNLPTVALSWFAEYRRPRQQPQQRRQQQNQNAQHVQNRRASIASNRNLFEVENGAIVEVGL